MSQFTGRQYKGAMRDRRATKRTEAIGRNARSNAHQQTYTCGHVHGTGVTCYGRVASA